MKKSYLLYIVNPLATLSVAGEHWYGIEGLGYVAMIYAWVVIASMLPTSLYASDAYLKKCGYGELPFRKAAAPIVSVFVTMMFMAGWVTTPILFTIVVSVKHYRSHKIYTSTRQRS